MMVEVPHSWARSTGITQFVSKVLHHVGDTILLDDQALSLVTVRGVSVWIEKGTTFNFRHDQVIERLTDEPSIAACMTSRATAFLLRWSITMKRTMVAVSSSSRRLPSLKPSLIYRERDGLRSRDLTRACSCP